MTLVTRAGQVATAARNADVSASLTTSLTRAEASM